LCVVVAVTVIDIKYHDLMLAFKICYRRWTTRPKVSGCFWNTRV